MKYLKYSLISLVLMPLCFILFSPLTASAAASTQPPSCVSPVPGTPNYSSTFLGLVPWYQYIPKTDFWETVDTSTNPPTTTCGFHVNFMLYDTCSYAGQQFIIGGNETKPCTQDEVDNHTVISGVNQKTLNVVWLVGLAIFEDLLRIAGLAAVGFVIYGGIRYTTSQGSPEQTGAALSTIIHALVGLAIAIIAATSIAFIAKLFK